MTRRKKRISFADWIEREGVDRLAKRLGINRFTILHWKAGRHHPRVEQMKEIKRMSRGEVDYQQMIEQPIATKETVQA